MSRPAEVLLQPLRPWLRLVERHPWSHNDIYARWITSQARRIRTPRPRSALDIGCGTGNLAGRLAGVVDQVTGLEPDPEASRIATERFAGDHRVRILSIGFDDRPDGDWDLVTMVAVLHHLPLAETLTAVRSMIKPGGRLVVVGLARETRADAPWSAVSVLLNPLMGLILHPRADGVMPAGMTAPARDPHQTLDEITDIAGRILPGVRIRRGLFFRYTLVWQA
jgi:SAM-dependent methyltransferase